MNWQHICKDARRWYKQPTLIFTEQNNQLSIIPGFLIYACGRTTSIKKTALVLGGTLHGTALSPSSKTSTEYVNQFKQQMDKIANYIMKEIISQSSTVDGLVRKTAQRTIHTS